MDRLTSESLILRTLYRFTQAQDRLDLTTMASLMVPNNRTIKFDLTKHFPEVGVLSGTAEEICGILYEAGAGWTATQHPVYNPVITWKDDQNEKATVQAMVQAYHCLENKEDGSVDSLTVRAIWRVEMERVDGEWLMGSLAMERDVPIANVGLFATMRKRMEAGDKRVPVGGSTPGSSAK